MKKFAVLILVVLAGCAADPKKLNDVATSEAGHLAKPSKPLSTFSSYELKPFTLSDDVMKDDDKVEQAAVLEGKIKEKVLPLFATWSSSSSVGKTGTLVVRPAVVSLRIVSGGARFWLGALSGQSNIVLDMKLIDSSTNDVIATPRITRKAGAWAGGWSIGKSDKNLHDYITAIAHKYLVSNY